MEPCSNYATCSLFNVFIFFTCLLPDDFACQWGSSDQPIEIQLNSFTYQWKQSAV